MVTGLTWRRCVPTSSGECRMTCSAVASLRRSISSYTTGACSRAPAQRRSARTALFARAVVARDWACVAQLPIAAAMQCRQTSGPSRPTLRWLVALSHFVQPVLADWPQVGTGNLAGLGDGRLLLVSSALSAPRQLAEDHGHVQVSITSDKGAGKPAALTIVAMCTFATSGSAPVFCH